MKNYKDVCIIEGKLSSYMNSYIREFRDGQGFERFSDDAILYGLLEYSKFPRQYNDSQRIAYIYDKCCSYYNYTHKFEVEYDTYGNFVIEVEQTLPF